MVSDAEARAALPLAPHVTEILIALADGPAHGYGIITQVESQSDGAVSLSTSSLYAALGKMEARGLVEDAGRLAGESGGPPRKYFRITELGTRVARLEALRLRETTARAAKRFLDAAPARPGDQAGG